MHRIAHRRLVLLPAALLTAFAVSACAPSAAPTPDAAPRTSDIEGVGEIAEPARALVVGDENGELTLIDLATQDRSVLAKARAGVASVQGDGRFIAVTRQDGARTAVDVVDTGRWTMPHGDHSHSFQTEARTLGAIDGAGAVTVGMGDRRIVALFGEDGDLVDLTHDDLDGDLVDPPRSAAPLAPAGPVLPFAGHLLVASDSDTVEVVDDSGALQPDRGMPCPGVTDADTTRVGAVFACTTGAVLFTRETGGEVVAEGIPYPEGATPVTELSGRPDRPDLAGVAGTQGAWLLDVRQRTWTLLPSDEPLVRAVAIGDDADRTVVVDAGGRVRVLAADGTVLARTEPLVAASVSDPALRERVRLIVDADHAYLTDPAAGAVHEIDHRDGAVVARTFTDLQPWFLQQVG
ncbi:hypothetical protein [Microbacterium sp. LWO13-1.2]|uniref:hypothetical protein n=1 Tax=Microbacterium sp. LWO13-1.2 TaxID=3135262 RepID=UPI003139C205